MYGLFQANLQALVKLRPTVLHLGDKGVMLLCRFLSVPAGFKSLKDANFINAELEKWHMVTDLRYNLTQRIHSVILTIRSKVLAFFQPVQFLIKFTVK